MKCLRPLLDMLREKRTSHFKFSLLMALWYALAFLLCSASVLENRCVPSSLDDAQKYR